MASKAREALMIKGKHVMPNGKMMNDSEMADGPVLGKAYTKDIKEMKKKKGWKY